MKSISSEKSTEPLSTSASSSGEMSCLQFSVFNVKEEKLDDKSKLAKRKLGRQNKLMGDLAHIMGSLGEAETFYEEALDILKSNGDLLW